MLVVVHNPLRHSSKRFPRLCQYPIGGAKISTVIVPIVSSMPWYRLKMPVNAYGEHNGVEVFWHVSFYDDVLQCMCLVRCVWIHTLGYPSFVVVSIKLQWFLCQSVDQHITKQPGAYFGARQLASFQFTGRCWCF
jgi:hypothetical protein